MDGSKFPRELLNLLPGPVARGVGSGIATALFARIALPILQWALEQKLPLAMATEYIALAVSWLPVTTGVTVFLFYLWRAYRDSSRNRG